MHDLRGLAVVASAPAEIIWAGEQNLSDREQYIDLNSDSLVDVVIIYSIGGNTSLASSYGGLLNAIIDGPGINGSNRILVDSSNRLDAALPYGTLISGTLDTTLEWKSGQYAWGLVSSRYTNPPEPDTEWRGILGENGNTYIRISFDVEESTHYGWIRRVFLALKTRSLPAGRMSRLPTPPLLQEPFRSHRPESWRWSDRSPSFS